MGQVTCTAKNITDEQIETLRREAIEASDDDMAAIAIIAAEGEFDGDDWAALSPSRKARDMSRDEAIQACVAALNAARDADVAS